MKLGEAALEHEDGWNNETLEKGEMFNQFVRENLTTGKVSQYDSLTEFHFSGMNKHVLDKIKVGNGNLVSINVLYEGGQPVQLHAVYDAEGQGHNIDIYLSGPALEAFRFFGLQKR